MVVSQVKVSEIFASNDTSYQNHGQTSLQLSSEKNSDFLGLFSYRLLHGIALERVPISPKMLEMLLACILLQPLHAMLVMEAGFNLGVVLGVVPPKDWFSFYFLWFQCINGKLMGHWIIAEYIC